MRYWLVVNKVDIYFYTEFTSVTIVAKKHMSSHDFVSYSAVSKR